MGKVLIGGVVGGLILFAWGIASHEILGIGSSGRRDLPAASEPALVAALQAGTHEPGMYVFPGLGSAEPTGAQVEAWADKWAAGPSGMLVYQPQGGEDRFAVLLLTELAANILCALCIAVTLLYVVECAGYVRRVLLATAFGAYATLEVDASNWNWWGYPTDWFLAQIVLALGGALLAGLFLARYVRAPAASCDVPASG
ncbi:MAG: hypothetical protein FJ296_07165 [Planctomycetes bacterium]|nr:hypothetical protein [Planctomycetota bacterium]